MDMIVEGFGLGKKNLIRFNRATVKGDKIDKLLMTD